MPSTVASFATFGGPERVARDRRVLIQPIDDTCRALMVSTRSNGSRFLLRTQPGSTHLTR